MLIYFYGIKVHLDDNFRQSIWPILFIGQLFGLMPVIGISRQSIDDLKFSWKSRRTIYGYIVIMLSTCYFMFNAYQTLIGKIFFDSIGLSIKNNIFIFNIIQKETLLSVNILFFATNTFGCISFLGLAMQWPDLMQYWAIAESNLDTLYNHSEKRSKMLRIRYIGFTILCLAFGTIFSSYIIKNRLIMFFFRLCFS